MEREGTKQDCRPGRISELLETLLLSLSVTGLWYYCYYLMAPWIWSQNIPFKPEDITPWILAWTPEHDGFEIYALYLPVFANIASSCAVSGLDGHLTEKSIRRALLPVCAAGAVIY